MRDPCSSTVTPVSSQIDAIIVANTLAQEIISMHRYGDLRTLTAVLSRRTLTRKRMALSLSHRRPKLPPSPDPWALKLRRTSAD